MAAAANRFLDSLMSGTVPEHPASIGAMERPEAVGGIVSSEEEQVLLDEPVSEVKRRLKPSSGDSCCRGTDETLGRITHQYIVSTSAIVIPVLA